jgi:hypothetical protein
LHYTKLFCVCMLVTIRNTNLTTGKQEIVTLFTSYMDQRLGPAFNRPTYVGNLDLRTEANSGIETLRSTLQYWRMYKVHKATNTKYYYIIKNTFHET